jgi:hypothetical protein
MTRRCYSIRAHRAVEGIEHGARSRECEGLSAESAPFRIPASARRAASPSLARRASVGLVATFLFLSVCRADEPTERQRAQLLEQMRSLAEQTKVQFAEGDRRPELVKDPAFRYADQPRRFIDATLWVWTDRGRPVAFQKIEALESGDKRLPHWQYRFASVSADLVAAEWSPNRRFSSTEPGVTFRHLEEAPAVSKGNAERKRQARELIRKFSALILTDPREKNSLQEMRLLTTPLFDYADAETKEYRGAVFGFSTNGTNPDLLLLLEVRGEKDKAAWHFAPARMTIGAVTLRWRDAKVWECEWVYAKDNPFKTWTFFVTARKPPGDDGERKR